MVFQLPAKKGVEMFDWIDIVAICISSMLFGFMVGSLLTELYMYKKFSNQEKRIDLTPKGGKR